MAVPAIKVERAGRLVRIVPNAVMVEWVSLRPELSRALKHGVGTHNEEDIFLEILNEKKQLWDLRDESDAHLGYMITEVFNSPRLRICRVVYLVGQDRAAMLKLHHQLVEWAKGQGCDMVLWNGRKGWLRDETIASEWKVGGVLFMKDLRDER